MQMLVSSWMPAAFSHTLMASGMFCCSPLTYLFVHLSQLPFSTVCLDTLMTLMASPRLHCTDPEAAMVVLDAFFHNGRVALFAAALVSLRCVQEELFGGGESL